MIDNNLVFAVYCLNQLMSCLSSKVLIDLTRMGYVFQGVKLYP